MAPLAHTRRLLAAGLAVLAAACATSGLNRARQADELRDYDLAVARYTAVLRTSPNNVEARQGLERAKLRASQEHFARGRRLASQGRYDDAALELQLATELNPTDADAEAALRQVRLAMRAEAVAEEAEQTPLEALLERSRDFEPSGFRLPDTRLPDQLALGQQSTARSVYLLIAQLTGLTLTFDPDFRDVAVQPALLHGLTLRQALDTVATATHTFYQVTGPSMVIVVPDTPSKRREYVNDVVRQFPLQNADLKETIDALRVVADARFVFGLTGTNTILVRDTPERVAAIGRFIAAFDKPRPEIVVDVEVLEVDRSAFREYGLQLASPGSPGIDGAADVNREGGLTLDSLRNLTQADVLLTNIPALYYRLLKTDTRTRTLANPHIRITDGATATANFGQRIPVPRLTVAPITQGGINIQPQTQFDYETIGVNIGITPRTHADDDVTLALEIELSSLGPPGFDGLPTFGTRNVETSIRLRDGETNILAGLIREDERTERQTVPGLGDIPLLGRLFGRDSRDAQQTDVVIMLTPHIIRGLALAETDLRPLPLPSDSSAGGVIIQPGPVPPFEAPPRDPVLTPTPAVPANPGPNDDRN